MAKSCSFDIVSEVNMAEVLNAVNQAVTEIRQRYDFKGSKSEIKLEEKENQVVIVSDDEYKLKSVNHSDASDNFNDGKDEDSAKTTKKVEDVIKSMKKILADNGVKIADISKSELASWSGDAAADWKEQDPAVQALIKKIQN